MFEYSIAKAEEFYEIKHFLKQQKTHSANRDDLIFCVRHERKLIGLARLLVVNNNNDALWLRGLYISPDWRSKGIASTLLTKIENHLAKKGDVKRIIAFAETHLQLFYETNDYQNLDLTFLPESLALRYKQASAQGKNWLCLQQKIG